MQMRALILVLSFGAASTAAGAQMQPYFCPPAEGVWVIEREYPEAPAWNYEARVQGNDAAGETTGASRVAAARRAPNRNPRPTRGPGNTPTENRPRVAPMLTHERAVGVADESADWVDNPSLPPVMSARNWLRVEMTSYGIQCRYSLEDGRTHSGAVRPVEAVIPINRRNCEPLMNTPDWRYDAMASGQICDTTRNTCQFYCSADAVLERW